MRNLKRHSGTTFLLLAIYSSQILTIPFARAEISGAYYSDTDYSKLEGQYIDAVNLGEDAKKANMIAMGVWGLSAATCGYNCFNYLVGMSSARKALVATALAVNKAVIAGKGTCGDGVAPYVDVIQQEYTAIDNNGKAADGSATKATGAKGTTDKQIISSPAGKPVTSYPAPRNESGLQVAQQMNPTISISRLLPWQVKVFPSLLSKIEFISAAAAFPFDPGIYDSDPGNTENGTQAERDWALGHNNTLDGYKAESAVKTPAKSDPGKTDTKATKEEAPADSMHPDESIAGYAQQMATSAEKAASWSDKTAKTKAAAGATGVGAAAAKACTDTAAAIRLAAQPLSSQAKEYKTKVEDVVSTGSTCNMVSVGAGVVDAGLSIAMAKDTTAGMLGLAGAAPGAFGLASSFLKDEKANDHSAASSGITSCLAAATSLIEVAVKVVGMNTASDSIDKNQKSLDELHSGAWLEKIFQGGLFGIESAHAAVEASLTNACHTTLSKPMARYACALAGDTKLRATMAGVLGGGEGLMRMSEAKFGISRDEFLSPTKPVSMTRVIGMMTKNFPQLAPGMMSLYTATERRAAELSKMPLRQRKEILSRENHNSLDQAASSFGQNLSSDSPVASAPTLSGGNDAFHINQPPVTEESDDSSRAPASTQAAAMPLPPPPGLGAEEISPANGKSLFELVSRTIRDHRELVGAP